MPTLVLNDVPGPLYEQIQRLALARKRTPADTVVEVLQSALQIMTPILAEPPPNEILLSPEIPAPCDIPWPKGELIDAVEVPAPLPTAHDFPAED